MIFPIAELRLRMETRTGDAMVSPPKAALRIAALMAVALLWTSFFTFTGAAWAQGTTDTTLIGGSAFSGGSGARAINQAAGVGNQEMNAAIVTDVPATLTIQQYSDGILKSDSSGGDATIGGHAFAGSSGITQVTQASGSGNIEANAAFIGIGPSSDAVSGITLSQVRVTEVPVNPDGHPYYGRTSIAAGAFSGATGVVQVDQTAGNNNTAANVLFVHFGTGK